MTKPVQAIDDEDERRAKRVTCYAQLQRQLCDLDTQPIQKKDLSIQEIDLLDKTASSAKSALAQTEIASSNDKLRKKVQEAQSASDPAIISAANGAGLRKSLTISSIFEPSLHQKRKATQEIGSIEPKKMRPTVQKPKIPSGLSEEKTNYLRLVLEVHESVEKVISEFTDHLEITLRKDMDELNQLQEEKMKAFDEYTKELSNKEMWSSVQTVARYVAYASSLVIGTLLLQSGVGGPAGYLLIAAGGLGLGASIAADAGVWKSVAAYFEKTQESQKHLAQAIEFATMLIPVGLGFLGSAMASPTHTPAALGLMAAALSTSAKLGDSWAEKKYNAIMAELEKINTKKFLLQEGIKTKLPQGEQWQRMVQQFTEQVQKIISEAEMSLS